MNEIRAVLLYSKDRPAFINNFSNIVEVRRDLQWKIMEGFYLEEMEWSIRKGYNRKAALARATSSSNVS
jgi:hypothetical protein